MAFKQKNVAVVGAGWVGGIRAQACAASAFVDQLHIAEIKPERAAEVAAETGAVLVTNDWRVFLDDASIDAIIIASTPESSRFPIVRAALEAGKHVMVEKPIAPTRREADEAIALAEAGNLKLTVGYTRRFDPKYAFVNKAIKEGRIGAPESYFGWGCWSSLSPANFEIYFDTDDDDDQGKYGPWFGWFANSLPGYPETFNLKCQVFPQNDRQRPLIELEPTEHPLSREQQNGITLDRILELYARTGHDMRDALLA